MMLIIAKVLSFLCAIGGGIIVLRNCEPVNIGKCSIALGLFAVSLICLGYKLFVTREGFMSFIFVLVMASVTVYAIQKNM